MGRTGSVTLAAQELSLTQGAVSRQIVQLEELLNVQLFVRVKKKLLLTDAGQQYAREIRDALRLIATSSLTLKANPEGGSVSLATPPTLGTRWLASRLADFCDKHPGMTINLTSWLVPSGFQNESLDAAITYRSVDWHGTRQMRLFKEKIIPACSPGFLERFPINEPADLQSVPLLHLKSRPNAWELWFESHGIYPERVTGMLMDQFATMAQVAAHSLGVALLPEFLIEDELKNKRLLSAYGDAVSSAEAYYYLVWPLDRDQYVPLIRLRDWLSQVA